MFGFFARAVGQVNSDSGSSVVYRTDARRVATRSLASVVFVSIRRAFGRLALGVEGIPYSLV